MLIFCMLFNLFGRFTFQHRESISAKFDRTSPGDPALTGKIKFSFKIHPVLKKTTTEQLLFIKFSPKSKPEASEKTQTPYLAPLTMGFGVKGQNPAKNLPLDTQTYREPSKS